LSVSCILTFDQIPPLQSIPTAKAISFRGLTRATL